MLLDFAQHLSTGSTAPRFDEALEPHPLFEVERINPTLERLAPW
jgi:hypothetical protein